jgi:hypothetical protein
LGSLALLPHRSVEAANSFFHDDLGPGQVFFVDGRFVPRHLLPKCEDTGAVRHLCGCPRCRQRIELAA